MAKINIIHYTISFLYLVLPLLVPTRCYQEEFEDTKGGNQNPYIEEEQKTQRTKEKTPNDKQRSIKHTYKTKDRVTRTPLKICGDFRCSGRVGSSCSTSGTCRVNLNKSFLYWIPKQIFSYCILRLLDQPLYWYYLSYVLSNVHLCTGSFQVQLIPFSIGSIYSIRHLLELGLLDLVFTGTSLLMFPLVCPLYWILPSLDPSRCRQIIPFSFRRYSTLFPPSTGSCSYCTVIKVKKRATSVTSGTIFGRYDIN